MYLVIWYVCSPLQDSCRTIIVRNYCGFNVFGISMQEMEPHEADLRGSRGVFYCGAAFFMMGCCNFYHTVLTIIRKRKVARQRKNIADRKRG